MFALSVKRGLGYAISLATNQNSCRRVILLYHAVGNGPDACATSRFDEQMNWLYHNAKVVSLQEVLSGKESDGLQVAITFDDGYASVARVAAPIMARFGFAGTIYLTVGRIAKKEAHRNNSDPQRGHLSGEQFLWWSEVKNLFALGWEIGSHGLDHVDMTIQNERELWRQLSFSRELIEEHTGIACNSFAYPWGRNHQGTRSAVEAAGYSSAASALHGPFRAESSMYCFPRVDIRREYTLSDFAHVLRGDWDFISLVQSLRQTFKIKRILGSSKTMLNSELM